MFRDGFRPLPQHLRFWNDSDGEPKADDEPGDDYDESDEE